MVWRKYKVTLGGTTVRYFFTFKAAGRYARILEGRAYPGTRINVYGYRAPYWYHLLNG